MRVKAEHLRAKHEAQERNYVDQQYERIWKNGMSADKLRNLEYVKHKYDAVKHLGEQMLYKALDEMEDSQVDEFYHALAKESAAKEQAQLQAEAEEKHKLEQQAQQRIQEQIQQNADNKKQRKMQRLVERDKTLFKSEQLRFDSFREDFQRRLEEKTKRSEIHTKEHNSIHEERQQALQREQKEAEETIKYLEKEKTERLAAEKKAKSQLRQEYFAQQQYSQQLMSASGNDALDKHIAEMQREQQYEALYTFLNNLKARQGLQYRINKELDNQIHIKGLDKVHRRKEKEQEKEQQAVEAALFLKRREEVEALRRQQALENADILRYQIQDRKEREKALADGTTEFFQTQKKNQEEEDAHIRLLAQSMLSSM
ncbi:trichohyalin-like [Paramacrobiotus metropolitanus]|uniref:trichohyalin-like n=1 Tax=Paramacrobiotus metropolitanus TaxID=2943436 RepID=UPI002445BA97|nr:trichohyalin-like [Paramacrobiotus metropolitanus]